VTGDEQDDAAGAPEAEGASAGGHGSLDQVGNRLRRLHKHLRKWGRRTGNACWRLYERDIADQPLIVDWYDGDAVVWAFPRKRNETPDQEAAWLEAVVAAVAAGLDLGPERVHLKRRAPQKDRQGGGQYSALHGGAPRRGVIKVVAEQGLQFEVNLSDYLDTGLFLDHRPTRQWVREGAAGKRVLNLFAYTGSFSCYACAGGAAGTVTVDMSNTYLDWAARNMTLNGFNTENNHLVKADCLQWLARESAEKFGIIICDPPTFSNSTGMEKEFIIQRDQNFLFARLWEKLEKGGTLWFSTNHRDFTLATSGIPPFAVTNMSAQSVPEDFRNKRIHQCWKMVRP
jgi:23S rRNA (cytosine1962-C5)-methyltransferase